MIQVCVFLGNPGREYSKTRHNVGWIIADYLDNQGRLATPWTKKFKGNYARATLGVQNIHLLKPELFYNKSGESLQAMLQFYKIPTDQVLVVHDDLESPFETLTLQFSGGLGGNNGLRSIQQHCGGPDFYRLKVGIGRPVHGKPDAWVLGKFTPDEEITLPTILQKADQLLEKVILDPSLEHQIKKGNKERWSL